MPDIRSRLPQHIPALRRRARSMVFNPSDADDLVHDTLVKAIEKSHQWREGTNLGAWLSTILRNLIINRYRQQSARPGHVEYNDETAQSSLGPSQESAAELAAVGRALHNLSKERRDIIRLICVEGRSYRQAAGATRVRVGTVRSRLFRAREQLYAEVRGAGPRSGDTLIAHET